MVLSITKTVRSTRSPTQSAPVGGGAHQRCAARSAQCERKPGARFQRARANAPYQLDNDNLRCAWLKCLGIEPALTSFAQIRSKAYDNLVDVLEASLDIPHLDGIIKAGL